MENHEHGQPAETSSLKTVRSVGHIPLRLKTLADSEMIVS